jgi:hypothetical protein
VLGFGCAGMWTTSELAASVIHVSASRRKPRIAQVSESAPRSRLGGQIGRPLFMPESRLLRNILLCRRFGTSGFSGLGPTCPLRSSDPLARSPAHRSLCFRCDPCSRSARPASTLRVDGSTQHLLRLLQPTYFKIDFGDNAFDTHHFSNVQ